MPPVVAPITPGNLLADASHDERLPELWRLAGALAAASEQGLPLGEALAGQADALRDAKRARLLAEGGRAAAKMIVPIVPVILIVLLVVVGAPAARLVLGLGS